MSIRVAVIGVGYLGKNHARVLSEIEGVELVGVVDLDVERAEETAGRHGCRAFTDYREVLPLVDALSIVTPTVTHHGIALECLRAGKDLFIEKPITRTVEEAEELLSEAEGSGRLIQVGHIERFNPAVLCTEGIISAPRFIESERLSPFLGRGTDVDVTLDLMIHDIDIILSLCPSRIVEVRAVGARVLTEKLDVAKAWIETEDGTKALITASRISPERRRVLRVFQDDGYILADLQSREVLRHSRSPDGGVRKETIRTEEREPLKEELLEFAACVKNGRRPRVTAHEGMEALKVALEINRVINENEHREAG